MFFKATVEEKFHCVIVEKKFLQFSLKQLVFFLLPRGKSSQVCKTAHFHFPADFVRIKEVPFEESEVRGVHECKVGGSALFLMLALSARGLIMPVYIHIHACAFVTSKLFKNFFCLWRRLAYAKIKLWKDWGEFTLEKR